MTAHNVSYIARSGKVLNAFLVSRWPGLIILVIALLWRSGWQVDNVFTGSATSAAIVFAMLHTRGGRRWLFLGWLTIVGIFMLNLVYVEFRWDVVKALAVVLIVGASWFVDWKRVLGRFQGGRTVSPQGAPSKSGR